MSSYTIHTIRYRCNAENGTIHEYTVYNRSVSAALLEFYLKRQLVHPIGKIDEKILNFTESLTVKEAIEFYNKFMPDRTIVGFEEDKKNNLYVKGLYE